jgi:multiple antibiotic resistance protein
MDNFVKSVLLMFVLLNPFIMSVYLSALIRELDLSTFVRLLLRSGIVSLVVFLAFAWIGDAIFADFFQVRFLSFLIFGGITFLLIGIRLILGVGPPVDVLTVSTGQPPSSFAIPFIIGPGTISASVLAGTRLNPELAALAISIALAAALGSIGLLKCIHDVVRQRNERPIRRYMEVMGRATALFTRAFAIEMILTGVERWLAGLGS